MYAVRIFSRASCRTSQEVRELKLLCLQYFEPFGRRTSQEVRELKLLISSARLINGRASHLARGA